MSEIFETGDKRMDFILVNHTKAMELEECLEHTKDNICISLLKQLKELLEAWGYDEYLEISKKRDFISWTETTYYDGEEEIGLYYSIEIEDGWDTLAGKGDYPVYIALCEDRAKGRKENSRKINAWLDNTKKILLSNKNKLSPKKIMVVSGQSEQSEWGDVLAAMYLEELSLDSLSTTPFGDIKLRLKNKVSLFVDALTGDKGLIKPFLPLEKK